MPEEEAHPDTLHRIQRAAEKVLADEAFARAPVMAHLLEYLVERTIQGVPVKSFTIAIEALGKGQDALGDADTYARVSVARLRKVLNGYYADHRDEDQLHIETGSYQVRLKPCSAEHAEAGEDTEEPKQPESRRTIWHLLGSRWRPLVAGCIVAAALAWAILAYLAARDAENWRTDNFPTVAIVLADNGGFDAESSQVLDHFRVSLRERLMEYIGFRLVEAGGRPADYEVRLDANRPVDGQIVAVAVVETATQRLVWSGQYSSATQADIDRNASRIAATIAGTGGELAEFAQRKRLSPRTPYGCWLRFTETAKAYSSRSDQQLYDCAEDWYAANPTSRVAAFLRNWSMVDASIFRVSEAARREDLEEALAVAHQALARDPDQAMLYVAEMRTYSFLGQRDELRLAADSALASAPNNHVVCGMVGTWLAFWNDPQAAQILLELDQDSDEARPWEHAGHFIAAMMRDDVQETGRHLEHLRIYMEGQPALYLLEAAQAGRSGRGRDARQALANLENHPRSLIISNEELIDRLPFAPEVRTRLREWIAYTPG